MTSSSKKITYTSDFKLKVLDYYFKHGGDENFGLKKKTAGHFNIDKKTINRMLNNPDMVKRARRLLAKRASSSKPASSTSTKQSRKQVKGSKAAAAGGKPSGGSGKAAGSVLAATTPGASGGAAGMIAATAGVAGTSGGGSAAAAAASSSKVRCIGQPSGSEGVKVLELPEDPDYSLLKRSISASANGVANVAKLLVTGTDEVRKLILNECEMILECKVCQNLFRSVVNFLAHKRIYCQEEFADVRTLFHRDNTQGVTSQSGTVVVEPEPPPPTPPPPPDLHPQPLASPPTSAGVGRGIESIAARLSGRRCTSGQAAAAAAATANASHPTNTGSSVYYERLELVNAARDKLSQDCSVVLEDIRGVSNARLQTFMPHSPTAVTTTTTLPHMSQLLEEVSRRGSGVSVALGKDGEVVMTARGDVEAMEVEKPVTPKEGTGQGRDLVCRLCNTRFATPKTLSVHQRSHHGLDRYVFSCPICQAPFVTMWGVIKHLEKLHKKTKHQIDRLKKVIQKNMTKKRFFPPSPLSLVGEGVVAGEEEEDEKEEGEEKEEEEEEKPPDKERKFHEPAEEKGRGKDGREAAAAAAAIESTNELVVRESGMSSRAKAAISGSSRKSMAPKTAAKREESGNSGGVTVSALEHRCGKCERRFMTPQALISHAKFCSLQQMKPQSVLLPKSPLSPRLRSETPEKRIAIQIRKDYKKSPSPTRNGAADRVLGAKEDGGHEGEGASKVEAVMMRLCHLSSLTCVPCGRRYQTMTTLKRHVSVHFNWTRYACRRCTFRSYNRYELTRHAVMHHGVTEAAAATLLLEDVAFGPVKYFLTAEDEVEGNGEGSGECDSPAARPLPHVSDVKVEMNGIESKVEEDTLPKKNKHDNETNSGWTSVAAGGSPAAANIKQVVPHSVPTGRIRKSEETVTVSGVMGEGAMTPQTPEVEPGGPVGESNGSSPPLERSCQPPPSPLKVAGTVEGEATHHPHRQIGCHEQGFVYGVKNQAAGHPQLSHQAPVTEKSRSARRKSGKRRRINVLTSQAATAIMTHKACNGMHSDEKPGGYKFPESRDAAPPLPPQPAPQDKPALVEERRKSLGNGVLQDSGVRVHCVMEGVEERNGEGVREDGGGGGVHHSVVEGK